MVQEKRRKKARKLRRRARGPIRAPPVPPRDLCSCLDFIGLPAHERRVIAAVVAGMVLPRDQASDRLEYYIVLRDV